ncbi:MAG TPA: protein phosphatase 2C domain-containing protein, partial [Actinomycetales bacterium]|nr:protein phosphatase 2C domain-containing protein [Actinomycetales bacterium]
MRTTWGLATDRGRVREINEDAILAQPPIFLVADGMGGYDAGDRASQIVVDSFRALAEQGSVSTAEVHSQFELATAQLREVLETEKRAGSTVAGAAVVNQDGVDYWLIFNIGDSRVYSWHEGRLKQISVDH